LPDEQILLPLLDKGNTFFESHAATMHDIITAEMHKQQYSSVLNKPNQAYAKIPAAPENSRTRTRPFETIGYIKTAAKTPNRKFGILELGIK
jgi:hypothetical protein